MHQNAALCGNGLYTLKLQAAQILINLTSQQMPSGICEGNDKPVPGPVVMDTEFQVSLMGLTALLALLHHSQFYREMSLVLSSYYPQPTIQASVTSDLYKLSESASDNTLSVLGITYEPFPKQALVFTGLQDKPF